MGAARCAKVRPLKTMKTHGKKSPKKSGPAKSGRPHFKKGPPKKGGRGAKGSKGQKPARRPPPAAAKPVPIVENPHAKALAQKMAGLALDTKALDVVILDVRGMNSYADYFVIASGESERQVAAMADRIHVKVKEDEKLHPIGTEGHETGNWVLLDYGEVVAHLFFSEVRAFYDLEGLWADAPRLPVAPPPAAARAVGGHPA